MQKVSKAYKESMKSSLRERAYIMISFGLVNQEAQAKATVDDGSYAYYSNKDNIFGEHIDDTVCTHNTAVLQSEELLDRSPAGLEQRDTDRYRSTNEARDRTPTRLE